MTEFETVKVDAPKVNLESITNEFLINFISNSISLETCDISKEVVTKILDNEPVECSETVKQLVNDYLEGFLYAVKLVSNNEEFTENTLKDLHQIIVKDKNLGGLYRNVDISVKGSNHTPPSYIKVYDRMEKYINYLAEGPKDDVFEYIAYCHLQLAKIHPFLDGNGRLARLVLNYELMSNGFAPVIITADERDKYHVALEKFKVEKETAAFKDYLKELELKSINMYY